MSDREEILETLARYAEAEETRDPDLFVSCFTPDAWGEFEGFCSVRGHEELSKVMSTNGSSEQAAMEHVEVRYLVLGMPRIIVHEGGETAEARTPCLAHLGGHRDGRPAMTVAAVRYFDRFRKLDGHWLIEHRLHVIDFGYETTPYNVIHGRWHANFTTATPNDALAT